MTTITNLNKFKFTKNLINEKKILLSTLKKVPTSLRISELLELIGENEKEEKLEVPKWGIALKAIIILFPKQERYTALTLLKNKFDIQLTIPQIEGVKTCLLQDPAFNKLLPFTQKKFLESFLPQQNGKKFISSTERKNSKKSSFITLDQNPTKKSLTKSKIYVFNIPKVDEFKTFLKQFSYVNKNDQFNLFFQFQQNKPELLKKYLTTQNIINLFQWVSEDSLPRYFKLPIIASAIKKWTFSWNDIVEMFKNSDNEGVYIFIDHLLAKDKLTQSIGIDQLKVLLIGLDYEKRLDFFNMLKSKHLISEINLQDSGIVELLPNQEDYWNNNIPRQPLFFWNKPFNLPITEEPNENISENKF